MSKNIQGALNSNRSTNNLHLSQTSAPPGSNFALKAYGNAAGAALSHDGLVSIAVVTPSIRARFTQFKGRGSFAAITENPEPEYDGTFALLTPHNRIITPNDYQYEYYEGGKMAWGTLADTHNIQIVNNAAYSDIYDSKDNNLSVRLPLINHTTMKTRGGDIIYRSMHWGRTIDDFKNPALKRSSVLRIGGTNTSMTAREWLGHPSQASEYYMAKADTLIKEDLTISPNTPQRDFYMDHKTQQYSRKSAILRDYPTLDALTRTTFKPNDIFFYKPPSRVIATELKNGLHSNTALSDVSDNDATSGAGTGPIAGLTGNILNRRFATSGVKLHLDYAVPSNGVIPGTSTKWVSVKFRPASGGSWLDVSDLQIEANASGNYSKLGFDICGHDIREIVDIHVGFPLPSSLKLKPSIRYTDISFTADLTNNMLLGPDVPIVRAVYIVIDPKGGSQSVRQIYSI